LKKNNNNQYYQPTNIQLIDKIKENMAERKCEIKCITKKRGIAEKQFLSYIKVVLADIPKLRKTGFECFDPFVIHCAKQPGGVARH
jgi:hypothetical protein